ncbi:hypothetical protein IFM89_022709 [Coptis chinensis]|uniref:UVR domain-containing protein n=1 Tax=Coptis chinensis TaxID=261450 RepID=A0A835HP00_9MAGN|nr:hypothetical protein IFM89_022709 [Coptis chinensis]
MDFSMEEEGMDSLFEGMVLFNPSSSSSESVDLPPPPSPSPSPSPPLEQPPSSTSSPLDENLFSDLTLITPSQDTLQKQLEPSSITRQVSRKKKKKASIKIGYARDTSSSSFSLPDESGIQEKGDLEDAQVEIPSKVPLFDSESKENSDLEDAQVEIPSKVPLFDSEIKEKSDLEDAQVEIPASMPITEAEVLERNNFEDTDVDVGTTSGNYTEDKLEEIRCTISDKLEGIRAMAVSVSATRKELAKKRRKAVESVSLASLKYKELERELEEACEAEDFEKAEREVFELQIAAEGEAVSLLEQFAKPRLNPNGQNRGLPMQEAARGVRLPLQGCEISRVNQVRGKGRGNQRPVQRWVDGDRNFWEQLIPRNARQENRGQFVKHLSCLRLKTWLPRLNMHCVLNECFHLDAADDGNLVLKNAEEVSLKETTEWLSSVEALEVKKMELEIESHLTNGARLGLNDSIELVIEDDRREQDLLCKKQDILKEELEILLALVRQKEAEIVENDSHVQVVEKRISDAISGFHDTQSNIDTKCHDLQSALAWLGSESKALSNKKKEIDDFLSQVEKRGGELKQLANVSMDEAKACQELVALRNTLALPILKCREVKLRLAKTEANILMEIQNLRQEVSAARASLQSGIRVFRFSVAFGAPSLSQLYKELSSARSTIQQEVTSVKQRIFFIDKRSPELEAEKRVAAVARNFKEAGRIASEVKALGVEKESLQTKMEADILQLGKIEEEIDITVKNLNEKEELILLKEKEAAKSGCERLRLVSATAMAERSAALELGDLEEANTLLAEAEAADSEAKQLQQAHDLKEEEFENTAKQLISIELIANLGRRQLAEMAASISVSAV